jgi:hypothetical protein
MTAIDGFGFLGRKSADGAKSFSQSNSSSSLAEFQDNVEKFSEILDPEDQKLELKES